MEQNISVESLKNYDKSTTPYYIEEIVPHVVKRKLFKQVDVGRLGTSATHLGMGKIHTKTSTGMFIVEFLNKTTIHGFNHIAAPHRHFVERILTMLFLGVALACLVVSSLHYWDQYQNNPTSMVVDFQYENFNVTKPAITVCLFDKVATEKFPEVFEKFGVKDTQEARNFFIFLSNATYATLNQTPIYNKSSPEKWLEILRDLYVNVELLQCSTGGNTAADCVESNSSTTDIITEKGMCTIVYGNYDHYASVDYWLSDNWTIFPKNDLPVYTYIYRNERISVQNILGPYEMAIHHPNELPKFRDPWYKYGERGVLEIKIDVQEVESSNELKKLSQTQRPCNYPEDGELKMWPVYTRNMCVMECRYNYFKRHCGCYPHFARPTPGIPICNATQLHCVGDSSQMRAAILQTKGNYCDCPDSCDTARYHIISVRPNEIDYDKLIFMMGGILSIDLQFPFNKLRHEVFFGFNEFLVLLVVITLVTCIFFLNLKLKSNIILEINNTNHQVVACTIVSSTVSVGGAAGLFLGASIISFVEILYYITLRLFCYMNNIYKHRPKE